ncbi:MAG: class I SAM-dependent methyltransferase [Chlamydiia bacterium]|nr:class I SAM-dependent methyltransferase [Chlamydiia bacterium]
MSYALLDSGNGEKWEQFGPYSLIRPCPQAIWRPYLSHWEADGRFSRDSSDRWTFTKKLPKNWTVHFQGVTLQIAPTDFGHLGFFPEHACLWQWMRSKIAKSHRVLNLFAYSGAATLAAAQEGAEVCHLDASKGIVDWARENARLNHLEQAPIRWIVDDALKFLKREEKRNSRYEGILLDPPTFGRGSKGEVFKIERDLSPLLEACKAVLSSHPRFLIFSCHTPGLTPLVLHHVVEQIFRKKAEMGEMLLESSQSYSISSGSFIRIAYD